MKKQNILIIAASAVFASCSTGNDITSNFFDDGIYFDPTYRMEMYTSSNEEEVDTNILGDYAYSESFDYYDPSIVSNTQPMGMNSGFNSGFNSWGMQPSFTIMFGFGNSFYNPYGFGSPFYNPYGFGSPFYNPWGYGMGYPGFYPMGYGNPWYGDPWYGNPYYGMPGYPGYCPTGAGGGSSNPNGWVGNAITSDWSSNVYRTKVNGPKTGSRSSTSAGTNTINGPKKISNAQAQTRETASQNANVNAVSDNADRELTRSRIAEQSSVNQASQVSERQPIRQRQTIKTRSGNPIGVSSVSSNESKVKSYYSSTENNRSTRSRVINNAQSNDVRRVNTSNVRSSSTPRTNVQRTPTRTSPNATRTAPRNYYNSGTNVKPRANTRSNSSNNILRSLTPSSNNSNKTNTNSRTSRPSNFNNSGGSRSSSPSSGRSSGGSVRSSGGRR